jgi:hypothetical protein
MPVNERSKFLFFSSEHVKDILRESYGEEMEEWFQKPKKTSSQGKSNLRQLNFARILC